jgi:hypothetical protein
MVDHPVHKPNQIYSGLLVLSTSFVTFESLRSKEFLYKKYHGEQLSIQQIAKECGVHRLTIWRAMLKCGISIRGRHHARFSRPAVAPMNLTVISAAEEDDR